MRPRSELAPRDQEATPFSAILLRFCDSTCVRGAALVDAQGETVDYAGAVSPFDIKVAAAEWQLVLELIRATRVPGWAETSQLLVRGHYSGFLSAPLSEGYSLIAQLERYAFGVSTRALCEAIRELCREAGLDVPHPWRLERWARVEVRTHAKLARRPAALWRDGRWRSLEILGRYTQQDLGNRELGFRARLESGADITIVREPLGIWYAADLPDV